MQIIALRAEEALRDSPHPALRLSELVTLLAPAVDRSLTAARLRHILEDHPDRFRLLDAWSRRWSSLHGDDEGEGSTTWVVAVAAPASPPDGAGPALRLRETVRWLGASLDNRSRMEVARWYAIAAAERHARRVIAGRVA